MASKTSRLLTRRLAISSGLLTMALPVMSAAQTAAPLPETNNVSQATDHAPDDIVVTANKREQRLSDVGLAVTALSGSELKTQHVTTLSDLAGTIPGLTFTPSALQTPIFTLRGVGFYETSYSASPAVTVYVDEVPLSFPVTTSHANFDLERVEVIKGPQGTLFGQNSTGGAINFIAAKPTDKLTAGGDISYGRFNDVNLNVYISGPLAEGVRFRVAGFYRHQDDWQYSYTRDDSLGKKNYYGGRILTDLDLTDRLTMNLSFNGWRDTSDPQAFQFVALQSQSPATTQSFLLTYPFAPNNARTADWTSGTPRTDNRQLQGAARINWQPVDGITVTSISSYVDWLGNQGFDDDGLSYRNNDFSSDYGYVHSFNQEVRISNDPHSHLRWVVGTNYGDSHTSQTTVVDFRDSATASIYGYHASQPTSVGSVRDLAGFGNLEYDLSPKFTFKAGARYTDSRRTTYYCNRDGDPANGLQAATLHYVSTAIQTGVIQVPGYTPTDTVVAPNAQGCLSLKDVSVNGAQPTYANSDYHGLLDQHNVSWRFGVDYKPERDTLLYANIARGYKAGSFPQLGATNISALAPVTQERLTSYEAGFKLALARRLLTLDGAVFYYDYANKQIRGKYDDPIFGVLDKLVNVPKSRMIGAELEATLRPMRGLTLTATGSFLDSKILDYVGIATDGSSYNYAGSAIPYTPKFQGRLSGDYTWRMGSMSPFIGASVSARTSAITQIGGSSGFVPASNFRSSVPVSQLFTIPGYTLVDLRAGATLADGKYTFNIYGRNVFNKFYLTNIYTGYDTIVRYTGEPATYGVSFAFKY